MSEALLLEVMKHTLWIVGLLCAPPLLIVVVLGLVLQVLQTVTQLKDQSLSFIPKAVAVGVMFVVLAPWYVREFEAYFKYTYALMQPDRGP
jgi:flagellar biosynthesis protein FliQ